MASLTSEIKKAGVIGGKEAGTEEAVFFPAEFGEQGNVVEQSLLVGTDPAANVGLSQNGQVIAASGLADLDGQALGVAPVEQVIRHLMVPYQRRHSFAESERQSHLPEDPPSQDGAAARVTPRTDPPIRIGSCTHRLGNVMKKSRHEEHRAFFVL